MENQNSLQERTAHLETLLTNIEKNRDDILWSIRGLTPVIKNTSASDVEFNSILSLKPETINLLNRAADNFISDELMNLLGNCLLKKYSFYFVAHHFFNVEDVIEDVSNGDVLKKVLPTGGFNKLKKELIQSQAIPSKDRKESLPNVVQTLEKPKAPTIQLQVNQKYIFLKYLI